MLMNKYLQVSTVMARESGWQEQRRLVTSEDHVLEVGCRGNVAAALMRSAAHVLDTLDINPESQPTYLGDVRKWTDLQALKYRYTTIFCCQVLEHMEQEESFLAIENMLRLEPTRLVLSLPDNRQSIRFGVLVGAKRLSFIASRPFSGQSVSRETSRQHHWEIFGGNLNSLIRKLRSYDNYRLATHYRLFDRPFQHFFILLKK